MAKKVSVKRVRQVANRVNDQAAQAARVSDSFQNFALSLGIGTDNALSGSTYGYNPITRIRVLLDWIHRGSWLGGMAIDIAADDMTRAGVDLKGDIEPDDAELLFEEATALGIWGALADTIKWARLYGGAIAVMLIDGQDMSTPLKIDRIGKGQFKGLYVFDRWMIEPSLNDLITDFGPDLGKPKFYTTAGDAPALRGKRIHYSRVVRMEGIPLPYFQRISENLWGLSVIERLYDRMIAFDSATQGAAQMAYKMHLRTLKLPGFRAAIAAGGDAVKGIVAQVQQMRRFQSQEGISVIDGDDEFQVDSSSTSMTGVAEALGQFGQQLAGALQIPLVRLFGQAPGGLSSDGDSALHTYYDGVKAKQNATLKVPVTVIYRVMALSKGIKLPDGFRIEFNSLWQMSENEMADLATKSATAVVQTFEAGIIGRSTALKELRQSSEGSGIFSNISDEDIEEAEDEPPPGGEGFDPMTGEPLTPQAMATQLKAQPEPGEKPANNNVTPLKAAGGT